MENSSDLGSDTPTTSVFSDVTNIVFARKSKPPQIDESDVEATHNNMETEIAIDTEAKKRSPIWNHFLEIKIEDTFYAQCKHCPTKYKQSGKTHGSTGNMWYHLMQHHETEYVSTSQLKTAPVDVTTKITDDLTKTHKGFCSKKYRESLVKWVVKSDQPHTEVERESFIHLLQSVNPEVPISSLKISADTIKYEILKLFDREQEKLKSLLAEISSKISITLDIWTSPNQYPFLGVKGHWISPEWEIREIVIDFPYLAGQHCGENIASAFLTSLGNLGIPLINVISITTDNASNNETYFDEIRKVDKGFGGYRVRCTAHIINLAVQDLLSHLKITPATVNDLQMDSEFVIQADDNILSDSSTISQSKAVVRLRKLVRMIRSSPQRREKLQNACILSNVEQHQLVIDVKTRWNSTYHMISRAIELKIPLISVCSVESELKKYLITEDEWMLLETVQNILQYFSRATEHISMKRHSTISSVIPVFDWLTEKLDKFETQKPVLNAAARKALEKLQKYYPNPEANPILFIAVTLTPSLKLQYFKEHKQWDTNDVKIIKKLVSDVFQNYYNETETVSDNSPDLEDDFLAHMHKRSKKPTKESEIHTYFKEPTVSSKIGVMDYWRINESNFPNLAKMAKDVFSVQSTSVPMEREFSGGVDLVVPTRSCLLPKTISATMCLKSWLN